LKYYLDIKNVVDTSREEGREEGREEEKILIIKKGIKEGISLTMLSKLTGYSEEEIKRIAAK
ncbi:MAG: hypothetical protein AAGJ93_17580, partial [Bacteroidota bacterium]